MGDALALPIAAPVKPDEARRICRRCNADLPLIDEHYNRSRAGRWAFVCRDCDRRGRPKMAPAKPVPPHSRDAKACAQCGDWYRKGTRGSCGALCVNCRRGARVKTYRKHRERIRDEKRTGTDAIFQRYKAAALARDIPWGLSHAQFAAFAGISCFYCGGDMEGVGVDRVDSADGYTIGNVVPCCAVCNLMKGAMGLDDWLRHMRKVVAKMRYRRTS